MVSVSHQLFDLANTETPNIPVWLAELSAYYSTDQLQQIERACQLVQPLYRQQFTPAEHPLLQHALGSASILASLNLDSDTLCACILRSIANFQDDWKQTLNQQFGSDIEHMVEGCTRIEYIRALNEQRYQGESDDEQQHIEDLRKMLLAMANDIRVVLIKLAERTQTLRLLHTSSPAQQQRIALETRRIFAPLANRLGIWQLKWELEDLSTRFLDPALYKKVAKLLDSKRLDREDYIADVIRTLELALQQAGIQAEVAGRPKHIYSIINKMRQKKLDFSQLYDVRALRILVEDIPACYTALSVVHDLWPPIISEYDDYIARPKRNNYRSIHTAVTGPNALPLEVQIRTHEMHHFSELGVAAHWRYKEKSRSDSQYDEKIAWLRQLLSWKEELKDQDKQSEQFKKNVFDDVIYVLTPQGKIIDLPKGATPVDFAYSVHTNLGHRTRGAKVNGHIVPLNYQLQNAEQVEILTSKHPAPSRDWLNPNLGFLVRSRARAKVRSWFNQLDSEQQIKQGKALLDKELQRLKVASINQEKLAQQLNYNKPEALLLALAYSKVGTKKLLDAIKAVSPLPVTEPQTPPPPPMRTHPAHKTAGQQAQVMVAGEKNFSTRLAQCCQPTASDNIIAYITRERGLSIHRQDCAFIRNLPERLQAKLIPAEWQPLTRKTT